MDIEKKVKQALCEMGYQASQIHLETTSAGNVGGFIISDRFKGKSEMNRQDELWKGLRQRLAEKDLLHIVAILTVTREEAENAA